MAEGPGQAGSLMIRPALADDAAAFAAIYRPAVEHGTASFETVAPDGTEMARRLATIVADGYPYLAAERAGVVVGFAYANRFRVRPAYRFTVENSVYVNPDDQGLGIGGRLLSALIDRASDRGFRQMIAVIGDSPSQGPSIALHRAAGFVMVGTLPAVGFKFGRWLDTVLMQRALGSGAGSPPPDVPPA